MFCLKDITIFPKNVYNLRRHIKTWHPKEFKMILKHAPPYDYLKKFINLQIFKDLSKKSLLDESSTALLYNKSDSETSNGLKQQSAVKPDTEQLEELSPKLIEEIQNLCKKSVLNKPKSKTCIWNFFKYEEDDYYTCIFCTASLKIHSNYVGNLKRHIMTCHKGEYKVILSNAPQTDSMRKKRHKPLDSAEDSKSSSKNYFDELYNGSFMCKHCNDIVVCKEDQGLLFSHIQEKHLEEPNHDLNDDEIKVVILSTPNDEKC